MPDVGEKVSLANTIVSDLTLRLFQNDVTAGLTPDEIDELLDVDFTEANFAGYAAQTLTGGQPTNWTITLGNPSEARHNTVKSFVRSSTGSAQLIFGYHITIPAVPGAVYWFEQFDAPISIEFINDQINITAAITLDDVRGNAVEAGTIVATGRTTAPIGWLLCDGAAVSRTTFADLFAAIGTAYGIGDGSTTFNVPDLRQRFPLGKAASGTGATLGGTGGAIDHVHDLDTSSSHAKLNVQGTSPNAILPADRKSVASWTPDQRVTGLTLESFTTDQTFGTALGGDSDVENPPFQTVNYLIKD